MKLLAKILEYAVYALVVFLALLVLASALPLPGSIKIFVVESGSMEPAIKTGSVVLVKPQSEYKVGDVVTFGPNTKTKVPTTHRIVSLDGQGANIAYTTRGDANNVSDASTIRGTSIIGKVLVIVPYVGYALAGAKKPIGFGLLIIVPALLIIFSEGHKIVKEVKKLRAKKSEDISEDLKEKNSEDDQMM